MGQVKIWLNSQPDISEMPRFLLLVMIIITVFLLLTLGTKESFFGECWLIFCILFKFSIFNVVVKKGVTATL